MSAPVRSKLIRGIQDPRRAWNAIRGRLRGHAFKLWCSLFRPRIQIGRNLILDGKLKIRGPGRVIFGNNVVVSMAVTPYTYASDAVIEIGDKVFLNGTRFSCKHRVRVGSGSILAECRITDYDFHSTNPHHRNDDAYIRGAPVTIEENVWIAVDCIVQKGVTVGRNSTVAALSLVRSDIPPNSIAGGNPAVVWKELVDREVLKPDLLPERT